VRFELWAEQDGDEVVAYELLADTDPRGPANLPNQPGAKVIAVIEASSYEEAKRRQHDLLGWEPYRAYRE
jgi:hypothetical protein